MTPRLHTLHPYIHSTPTHTPCLRTLHPYVHSTPTYTPPLHTLHDPYSPGPLLFRHIPGVRYVRGYCNRIPQVQPRQQQPKTIKCKTPRMLRTVTCQDAGKLWSQALTRSMERESTVAVPRPVVRKARPPLAFTNPEPPPRGGEGPALKETCWWPSQGSAFTVQICHPVLCGVPLGVGPLGLSKQKTVNTTSYTCVSRSQPIPLHTVSCTVTFADGGPFDVLTYGTRRW